MTVYRKERIVAAALDTSVHVDRVEVADLDQGTYVRVGVAAGSHTFYADEEKGRASEVTWTDGPAMWRHAAGSSPGPATVPGRDAWL